MNLLKTPTFQALYARRHLFAVSAALSALLVLIFGHPVVMGPGAAVVVWSARMLQRRYLRTLEARMERLDSPVWEVRLNHVNVGTISDRDYAAIRHRVFSDRDVYGTQVLNLLRMAMRAFDYCYLTIPVAVFWFVVVTAVFSPETLTNGLDALHKASAQDIQSALGLAGNFLVMLMIVAVGVHRLLGLSSFGFVNRFAESVRTSVRMHCETAAEGEIVLVHRSGDRLHINHELG